MRKITREATEAFLAGVEYKKTNTSVEVGNDIVSLLLHGNRIASRNESTGDTSITLAGWNTNTTRERLNGLPNVRVSTKLGQAYLNGEKWDGSWLTLKK